MKIIKVKASDSDKESLADFDKAWNELTEAQLALNEAIKKTLDDSFRSNARSALSNIAKAKESVAKVVLKLQKEKE